MQIENSVEDLIGVLSLSGRLTVNDQPGVLKDAVTDLVHRGARHVILDLSRVGYIDSTRLGELIAAHVRISRNGGRLILAATPPRVVELLTLSSLADVFEQFRSVEDARASFSPGR